MRIYYLSDLHIEELEGYRSILEDALPLSKDNGNDWVVVAGDISSKASIVKGVLVYLASKFGRVLFVMGNHEYRSNYFLTYENTEKAYKTLLSGFGNIHFLNNEVLELDGLRVAGSTSWYELPDNYSKAWWKTFSSDYVYVHSDWNDSNNHHNRDYEFLRSLVDTKIDLLVTHFPPRSFIEISEEYVSLLPKYSDIHPRYWICGHEHVCIEEDFNGSTVLMNPMGYPGESTAYSPRFIEIEPSKS